MFLKKIAKAYVRNFLNRISDLKKHPDLKRNEQWKNRYKGNRCFILGSGMSINSHDLSLLRNEIVMTQNNFFVHPAITTITPKFHVVVPHYHPKSEDPKWIDWFQSMEKALPNDCSLFAGLSSKAMLDEHTGFKDRSFYIRSTYNPLALKCAEIDISKDIVEIQTVLSQCLAIVIYMGFESVYLVGFDLDQICHKSNAGRFYGLSKITDTDAERKIDDTVTKTSESWYFWWTMHLTFDLLQRAAKKHGVRIYNATGAGMLETFERVNFSSLFKNVA